MEMVDMIIIAALVIANIVVVIKFRDGNKLIASLITAGIDFIPVILSIDAIREEIVMKNPFHFNESIILVVLVLGFLIFAVESFISFKVADKLDPDNNFLYLVHFGGVFILLNALLSLILWKKGCKDIIFTVFFYHLQGTIFYYQTYIYSSRIIL